MKSLEKGLSRSFSRNSFYSLGVPAHSIVSLFGTACSHGKGYIKTQRERGRERERERGGGGEGGEGSKDGDKDRDEKAGRQADR